MMHLQYLADKINEDLGRAKYCVWLNTNSFPTDDERPVVVMNVMRSPFSMVSDKLNVETLNITLTFDVPVGQAGDDLRIRDVALADIESVLLGWRTFEVKEPIGMDTNGKTVDRIYKVTTKFEQQPMSAPYADSGRITQQIVVSGSALVQEATCQAVLGNNIKITINGTELLRTTRAVGANIGSDNNLLLSEEKLVPEMMPISVVGTKTISFLYTGEEIEKTFLRIAEGIVEDPEAVYTYSVMYSESFSISQQVKIVGVSAQDDMGVYLQYTLNLQVIDNEE